MGERNEVGERLIEFCDTNELRIRNTCFKKPKSTGIYFDLPRWEVQEPDVLVKRRWKSMVKDVQPRPRADCGLDHELLMATLKLKLKRTKKAERRQRFM